MAACFLYSEVNVSSKRVRGYNLRSGASVTRPEGERGTLTNLPMLPVEAPSVGG